MTQTKHHFAFLSASLLTNKKKQQGIVLMMALIILVAMTMAGIAMVRSVDTANIVAGNLAFRQSTLLSTDAGIQAGHTWLRNAQAAKQLDNDNIGAGYRSSVAAAEPDWLADATWAGSPQVGPDAAGNTVQYLMYRYCDTPNTPPFPANQKNMPNKCSTDVANSDPSDAARGNNGDLDGGIKGSPSDKFYYRVVARAKGPRNSISLAMATMIFQK